MVFAGLAVSSNVRRIPWVNNRTAPPRWNSDRIEINSRTMTQRTHRTSRNGPVSGRLPLAAVLIAGAALARLRHHRPERRQRDQPDLGSEDNQLAASPTNIASLTSVVQNNPNDPQAYNMRGSVFGQSGRNEEALADFNKAISLDPNYAQAYGNRGSDPSQDRQARSGACRLQQGAHARPELRGGLSRPRHRVSAAQAAVRRVQGFQQGDLDPPRQRRGLLQPRPALPEPEAAPVRDRRFLDRHRPVAEPGRALSSRAA